MSWFNVKPWRDRVGEGPRMAHRRVHRHFRVSHASHAHPLTVRPPKSFFGACPKLSRPAGCGPRFSSFIPFPVPPEEIPRLVLPVLLEAHRLLPRQALQAPALRPRLPELLRQVLRWSSRQALQAPHLRPRLPEFLPIPRRAFHPVPQPVLRLLRPVGRPGLQPQLRLLRLLPGPRRRCAGFNSLILAARPCNPRR